MGQLDSPTDIVTMGAFTGTNISANYFFGDGSGLTGLSVLWTSITGRPTYLSNFTDDLDYTSKNVNSSEYWDDLDSPTSITGLSTSNINSLNWTVLQNYPDACPSGAITTLGDTVTCTDGWVDITGDSMSGNLTFNPTKSVVNVTYVTFSSGGYIYDNGTALILGHL